MVTAVNHGDKIKTLQNELASLKAEMEAAFQADDGEKFDALVKQIEAKEKEIDETGQRLAQLEKRLNSSGGTRSVQVGAVRDSWLDDPKLGYNKPADFLMEVMGAYRTQSINTPQLKYLAAAGSDEHSTINDSFGGFLVPEAFSPNMLSLGAEEDPTAARVTQVPMTAMTVNIPARTDKNHTSSVSGGLTVSREAETQSGDSSRMQTEKVKLESTSLIGVSYATEELLNQSPMSFVAILDAGFRDEFASTILNEKLNGVGAGAAVGVIDAACTISVAKSGGQAADTLTGTNISAMRARCWRYSGAIWLANHDCYDQISQAHRSLTNDDVPLFVPGNGTDVPDTLLGRPIFFTEYTKTIGDKGDIILGNWSQYLWGTYGSQTPQRAESIHVRFLNNERTFRFVQYNTGAPWWKSALTPKNGANTLSPFVVLAERA